MLYNSVSLGKSFMLCIYHDSTIWDNVNALKICAPSISPHFPCTSGNHCFFFFFFIVLVLPYINLHPPWVYTCSSSWTPSHLPPHTIPPCHPSAPAPSILYQTWTGNSFLIWYYTHFNTIPPNHPTLFLSHWVQKTVLYICVSFATLFLGLCSLFFFFLILFYF